MSCGNHHAAYLRRLRSAEKITQDEGEYQQTIFFSRGRHRGILSVWEHRMEWNVFADTNLEQHLDWNHPDSKCLDNLPTPVNILYVVSAIIDHGFKYDQAYDADGHLIEC